MQSSTRQESHCLVASSNLHRTSILRMSVALFFVTLVANKNMVSHPISSLRGCVASLSPIEPGLLVPASMQFNLPSLGGFEVIDICYQSHVYLILRVILVTMAHIAGRQMKHVYYKSSNEII